jgi:diaminohydroxyphosphoribosylaminopyrimidine deaminase/5-amino-6-(5-phosphoribosylamino)uracil reductase
MLEGGSTLASAFLKAGAVNAVRWYIAPAILGAGHPAIEDFGVQSIADVLRLTDVVTTPMGSDICVTGLMSTTGSTSSKGKL